MRVVCVALGLLAVTAAELEGQIPFTPCLDRTDQPIQGVVDNTLPYAGVATITRDGSPIIFYNKSSVSRSSPQVRRFVYLHECGHHALRHVWKDATRLREMEADCWAVQHMVEQGLLEARKVDDLQAEIGIARGIGSLKGCLEIKTDEELWHQRLDLLSLAGAHTFDAIRGDPIIEDPEPGFFESTLDLPGVFNCELTPQDSFVCLLFDGRDENAAADYFEEVRAVVEGWLTHDWMTFERTRARPTELRRFVAQEIQSGALLTLVATSDHDIRFEYQPVP